MKQINLVPLSVRQKAVTRRAVPYIFAAVVAGFVLAGMLWAALGLQVSRLKSQEETLIQAEQLRQQQAAKEAASLQVDADLTTRVNQLNLLAKSDVDWRRAFAYVASITPKDIVLSTYSFGSSTGGTLLKISGTAPSNVSYATFAAYLKEGTGKTVTSFKVDGYTYEPKSGSVAFTMTITVPTDKINFETKS
jgi:hypothetical protein